LILLTKFDPLYFQLVFCDNPCTFRLTRGAGPVYISGTHAVETAFNDGDDDDALMGLEEEEDDDEDEEDAQPEPVSDDGYSFTSK